VPGGFLPSGILLSGEAYSSREHGRTGLLCTRPASAHDVSWGAQAAGLLAAAASRR